eukprot:GDKI01028085.1.p1 GENE.GDKI01028085.1~~GDKI01028085.1.p1  ORF type:complete len:369 (-),score=77.33 GDKI01028085.1:124-1230(-)
MNCCLDHSRVTGVCSYAPIAWTILTATLILNAVSATPSSAHTPTVSETYAFPGPVPWDMLAESVKNDFTMNGQVQVQLGSYMYHDEKMDPQTRKYPAARQIVKYPTPKGDGSYWIDHDWTAEMCEYFLTAAANRDVAMGDKYAYGGASLEDIYNALDVFRDRIEGKDVVVFGSGKPWVESVMHAYGRAKSVTTVEYSRIKTDRRDIFTTYTVDEFRALNHTHKYDVGVSYSSIEHDGLGRYSDPIHPNADVFAMQQFRQSLKPGGLFLLAVPTGVDLVVWNEGRVYGPIRWPKITHGWQTVAVMCSFGIPHTWVHPNGTVHTQQFAMATHEDRFAAVLRGDIELCTAQCMFKQEYSVCTQPLWVLTPQ